MTESAGSRSLFVAFAVSVAFVFGEWLSRATVAVGAVFCTVTGEEVMGEESSDPSFAVTRTRIRSPRSPLPAVPRFSVDEVAPPMSEPFFVHW